MSPIFSSTPVGPARPRIRTLARLITVGTLAVVAATIGAGQGSAAPPPTPADSTLSPQGVDAQGKSLQHGGKIADATTMVSAGPPITRSEIIARAETWLHPPVPYSQDVSKNGYRTDCSGYVSMAWKTVGNFWTGNLANVGVPIAFNDLRPGDMLLFHNPANPVNGSHVVIFHQWNGVVGGDFYMYEQSPSFTKYRTWSSADPNKYRLQNYKPYRYINIVDDAKSPGDADVNGDGRSDLVAQNATNTWVMLSNGTSFGPSHGWSDVAFTGGVANHAGDLDGDDRADLVAQNRTDTWVMLSTGASFGSPHRWSNAPFAGRVANHIGDIDGDGRADLVAQNGTDTWVMLSARYSFVGPYQWSNVAFAGELANHIGDVNGDGRADLVAQNSTTTWVMLSTGTSFDAPQPWSNVAFAGGLTNHIGDVNGDGRADLVAQNATTTWVMLSTGTSFGPSHRWSNVAFAGGLANHVGDVDGDGRAELVAHNATTTYAVLSARYSFVGPYRFSDVAFAGGTAVHG
jgi:hypothetical protein